LRNELGIARKVTHALIKLHHRNIKLICHVPTLIVHKLAEQADCQASRTSLERLENLGMGLFEPKVEDTDMKLMTGNSNLPLAQGIADYMNLPLTNASVRRFADNEIFVEIHENVRGEDMFVIQSTSHPANDNLMELLIMIDALRRASAKRITAVLPYFGYARQDRKPGPRTPISAKLVANLITEAGADRVLTVDLHAGQIQGFFDIPTDNLYGAPVMSADILERHGAKNFTVVSPDVGGVVRARALAKRLDDAPLAIVDKRREKAGVSEVMNIIGDVKGRFCILIDDIADSAGTLCNAADALKAAGASDVVAYITQGVLSGEAVNRVNASAPTTTTAGTMPARSQFMPSTMAPAVLAHASA
jgi:ribose-phosphate pyrophosphokinase